jgi:hypothetical protein
MATCFLHIKTFSRGKGSSATRAAAYRAGERIRDERSGAVHDHTDRTDVAHAEIVLPAEFTGRTDMAWARNRSTLWNAVQQSGRRWDSRLARDVLVLLPPEMTRLQRRTLARKFSGELADRFHSAVDFAVHEPRATADQRHHHAHILMTSRQVGPEGIGAPTNLELSGTARHARGLGPSKNELLWMRERWAQVANEALRDAGLPADMDHRSYRAQGIDREPKARIPPKVFYAERRLGTSTPAGDDIRARRRERVEARMKGGGALDRVLHQQKEAARQQAIRASQRQESHRKIPTGAMTREQLNAKRREYFKANADKINRKHREYYQRHQADKKAAKQAMSNEGQSPAPAKARALGLAEQSAAAQGHALASVTAAESVQRWLALRESQKQVSAQDSVNRWLAYRESEKQAASSQSPSPERTRGPDSTGTGPLDDDAPDKNPRRERDHDAGL